MTLVHLTTLSFLTGLLGGCGTVTTNSYCDLTTPLYFDTQKTTDWLLKNDRHLLADIVVGNETYARVCGD